MHLQFTPIMVLLLLASLALTGLAVVAWRRQPAPGAVATSVLLAAVAWWTFTTVTELASQDLATKLLWAKASYLGIVVVPLAWLATTWQFAQRGYPARRGLVGLLLVIPGLVLVGVLTNELHGLVWSRVDLVNSGGFFTMSLGHGPLFWVFWLYTMMLLIGGALVLVGPFRTGPASRRRQTVLLWLAVCIPWLANLLYVSGGNPLPLFDPTPFAFALTAIVVAGAILRYGLLDIWPYARELTVTSMEDALIVINLDGSVVQANPAASLLLGIEPTQLIGRPARTVLPAALQETVAPGAGSSTSQVLVGELEEARWIEVRKSPVRDGAEQQIGTLLLLRDVTDRKNAELARQQVEAQRFAEMAALFETALAINRHESLAELLPAIVERAVNLLKVGSGGLFLVRPDKHSLELVIEYNLPQALVGTVFEFGEGLSGRVAQSRQTMMLSDYSAWELRSAAFENEHFHRSLAIPLHTGGVILGVLTLSDAQTPGDFSPAELQLAELFAEQAAIAIDKTQLLEAEQEQRRMAEALRDVAVALNSSLDLDRLFDLLLEQIGRVIPYDVANVMGVEDGVARVVRQRGIERYGAKAKDELLSVRLAVDSTPNLRTMFKTRRPLIIADVALDPDWIDTPSSEHIRSWAGAPIVVQGEVVAFYSLNHDQPGFYHPEHADRLAAFASQAGTAVANARLYGELNEALEARVKLLQSVSHELRTPLTIVLGYAELLKDLNPLDETLVRHGLGLIMEQGAQLKRLVDQLITFQELEGLTLRPVEIRVAAWIDRLGLAWTPLLAQRQQQLRIDIKAEVGCIRGDQDYLDKVLTHLVENASRFSPVGTKICLQAWHMEQDGERIVAIAVVDLGAGINIDQLTHIFDSFYQVEEVDLPRAGGLGLGLAIAQVIVALHGGRIWAASPGKDMGSTFIFTLPACD